jgi:ubiquinone/menaquinone biosynthesis C-methylase UbiE
MPSPARGSPFHSLSLDVMVDSSRSFRDFERAGWEDAQVVELYEQHLSRITTQSIGALLDAANVRSETRVLDVGTGPGYVAGAAAQRGANAVGIDFSAALVERARNRYPAIRFEQADAEALPFEASTFDAVVNGFGICHVPRPDVALREAFRVLNPGGRIAFTVFDLPERAVAFGAVYAAVRAHGILDVGLPAGPSYFLFSDPDYSRKALLDAGFSSPTFRQVPQVWRVTDPDQVFEIIANGSVRAAATLRAQSSSARASIKASIRNTVSAYKCGENFDVPAPAVLAAAIKEC